MPLYDYQCPICGLIKEVRHSSEELDKSKMSKETLNQISCIKQQRCLNEAEELEKEVEQAIPLDQITFNRAFLTAPGYNTFGSKSLSEKAAYFKARSDTHYNKETKEVKRQMLKDAGLKEKP